VGSVGQHGVDGVPEPLAAAAFHAEVTAKLRHLLSPLAPQDREQFRTAMAKITQSAGWTAGSGEWPAC